MILRPSLVFGEHWEDGRIVQHKVNTYRYWKKKLKHEINTALAMRDTKSLAGLVESIVFLRDLNRESVINSKAMILLMSGLSSLLPNDEVLRGICTEYYSKMTKSHKFLEQKLIIGEFCNKVDLQSSLNSKIDFVTKRIRSPDYRISTISELRIAVDLFDVTENNIRQHVSIIKADHTASVPVVDLVKKLKKSDYVVLINRVDKIPSDLESWQALEYFLTALTSSDDILNVKNYIKS